jgi:hypothetical protein
MITSQVRLQPMDKWEDYPIMVTLPTVSSFSTCGCFLRVEHSFSRMISLLFSLACVWPLGRIALCFCEWRRLQQLRVEGSSGARKGRPNRPPVWARPVGLGRPAQAHPVLVQSPLRSRGSSCIFALYPLHLHHFDDVILVSKMEVLLAWSLVFYASILGDIPL